MGRPRKAKPVDDNFLKYGLLWKVGTPDAWIEMRMIQKGGKWVKKTGGYAGEGTEFHFRALIALLWPEIVFHKWLDLFIENYLKYRTIVVLGPASSGKTFCAAVCVLADWYCYPSTTTAICCSTTRERLEDRVWGEIKKHHRLAKDRYPWLDGNLIEGRQRIVLDAKGEASEGRDFRNGLVGVPCFCAGTMVDTDSAPRPIESVKAGDEVVNAIGIGRVTETHFRYVKSIVRVTLSDGRFLDCTPEHPFFTSRGWINAIDLRTFDMVLSGDETLSLLQPTIASGISKPKILQCPVPKLSSTEAVQTMRQAVPSMEPKIDMEESLIGLLQSGLCWALGSGASRCYSENRSALFSLRQDDEQCSPSEGVLLCEMQAEARDFALRGMRPAVYFDSGQAQWASNSFLQHVLQAEIGWSDKFVEGNKSYQGRDFGLETFPRCSFASSRSHGVDVRKEIGASSLVRDRHCYYSKNGCNRNRRSNPPDEMPQGKGSEKKSNSFGTRVERVEVLKSESDPRFNRSREGYPVYNLEVDGHPSYSVNGVIVHNCKKGDSFVGLGDFAGLKNKRVRLIGDELSLLPKIFVDSISNLDKNPDLKVVAMGNPKETTDALGVLAEPAVHLGGWDAGIDQTPETKTWEIRRPQGICLQFPGTDSPNLDGRLGIPLITQEQIDRDVAFYGKDSLWFTMMDQGMMPRGQGSRRVLTRSFCLRHRAMEEPMWANTNRTRIGCLDAAYRAVGGDRCVFSELQFGYEITPLENVSASSIINQRADGSHGRQILALIDVVIVPIVMSGGHVGAKGAAKEPEDQIVKFVKEQCERRSIPPQNFFYDSGMRSSLVQAFNRDWSTAVNAIDFGGRPSERPVSSGIEIKCCDYYSKFVTELWFSVRLVVEADQFRGMTEDVMMEGCSREWTLVGANKTEIETKEKMKLKTGRSPDLFDTLVCGVEGARRLGFSIANLAAKHHARPGDDAWKRELREQAAKVWHEKRLNYAA